MRTIKELGHIAFYEMGSISQFTIDCVSQTEDILNEDLPKNEKEQNEQLTNIGAFIYDIDITLEIFNPDLEKEIGVIKDCNTLLEIRKGKIEALEFKKTI